MLELEKTAFLLITGAVALACLWGLPPWLARSAMTFWSALATLFAALVNSTTNTQLGKTLVRFWNRRWESFKRRAWAETDGIPVQQLAEAPAETGFSPSDSPVPDWNQIRQLVAFVVLVFGIFAYGVVFWWYDRPYAFLPGWAAALNQTILVQALLAVMTGLLLAHIVTFFHRMENSAAPWSALIVRGIPLAFLFSLGFFYHELGDLYTKLTRVQTPYFLIEFRRGEQTEEVKFELEPKSFETSFQAGAIFLGEAIAKSRSDIRNLALFCGSFSLVLCDPPYLRNDTTREERTQKLIAAFASIDTYASAINGMTKCLEYYSDRFENGVPIQEELSEIATNYTSRRSEKVTREFEQSIENIRNHLEAFGLESEDPIREACTNFPKSDQIEDLRDAVLESEIVLPYRSMLEAAILTASGYAVEGARHLEREYKRFTHEFAALDDEDSSRNGSASTDLMEVVLRTRMLSMLEQMFWQAQKPDDQIGALREVASLLRHWLSRVIGKSALSPKEWFAACRDGEFWLAQTNDEASAFLTMLRKLVENKDGAARRDPTPDDFESYLIDQGATLTYTNIRLFEELFWRESQPISVADLELAEQYARLASNEPELLRGCFGRSDRPLADVETTRFYILRSYGFLQAAEGSRAHLVDPGDAFTDGAGRKESLCRARSTLREARRVGLDAKERDSDSSTIGEDLRQLERVLMRVAEACPT